MHGVLQGILESEGVLQASYNVSLGGNAWPDSGCLLLAALLRNTRRQANGHREMQSCTMTRKNVREPFARGQREVEPCTLSQDECSRVACRTGEGCSQTHCATAGINLTVCSVRNDGSTGKRLSNIRLAQGARLHFTAPVRASVCFAKQRRQH